MKKKMVWGIVAIFAVFCLWGCADDDSEENNDSAWVLNVKDIPGDVNILGAALIADVSDDNVVPSVVGINIAGTFTLYDGYNAATGLPDFTKPWKGSGTYYIVLSTTADENGEQYFYTAGNKFIIDEYPYFDLGAFATYNFTKSSSTINWNQFDKMPSF